MELNPFSAVLISAKLPFEGQTSFNLCLCPFGDHKRQGTINEDPKIVTPGTFCQVLTLNRPSVQAHPCQRPEKSPQGNYCRALKGIAYAKV